MVISSHHGCNPMGRKHRQAKRENDTTLSQSTIIISAGYGRNRAIAQSIGRFLCFLDAVSCVE